MKIPKGLIPSALANMGERFGFYTMMAILVLFLEAKFNLGKSWNGIIYSVFYASIYLLALVGGIIADRTRNYKGTILIGLLVMSLGYVLMAFPTPIRSDQQALFLIITLLGLFTIAFGNGLFKGNLQALVGQMYDNDEFKPYRDRGYQIFYLFINVGAFFAPLAATGVRNWWLHSHGFAYKSELPSLCHSYLDGKLAAEDIQKFETFAREVSLNGQFSSLQEFATNYLDVFVKGYHYAFIVSVLAMLISLLIYLAYKKFFPDVRKHETTTQDSSVREIPVMSKEEIRQRIYALLAVYAIVIFFWFSFHQNGLTLTYFAKEYTHLELWGFPLTAEIFQSINPLFIIVLTPIIIAFFGFLSKKNMEPSTPKKIAIGMFIAALAYLLMMIGSFNLPPRYEIQSVVPEELKVTPWLLIGTYFILTVAELFISPLGISFVSKVAPPQYQGLMQGGWLGATAIGNQLLFIGGLLYANVPLWITWLTFVVVCLLSMLTMIMMLRWLEKFAK
ncbi:MAG: peptide MFS transporter [Bacteroidales bacterium]|nr:peptide MFS transporter [Bacteroidales bacterium]